MSVVLHMSFRASPTLCEPTALHTGAAGAATGEGVAAGVVSSEMVKTLSHTGKRLIGLTFSLS